MTQIYKFHKFLIKGWKTLNWLVNINNQQGTHFSSELTTRNQKETETRSREPENTLKVVSRAISAIQREESNWWLIGFGASFIRKLATFLLTVTSVFVTRVQMRCQQPQLTRQRFASESESFSQVVESLITSMH